MSEGRKLISAIKTLVFIPTYNERENVEEMVKQLVATGLNADILFLDDGSPDGTGELLNALAANHVRLKVIHRSGKLGVGGAHQAGIAWAYENGYGRLITMDCDFTHSPSDIGRLLEFSERYDVVVGSRYLVGGSLPGWNLLRKFLTYSGHFLTSRLLNLPHDATGAFRVYDLSRVPRRFFSAVRSQGYSFFFESLFLLQQNGISIGEVPIILPARTYGHSKMSLSEAVRSALRIFKLYLHIQLHPQQFRITEPFTNLDPKLYDPQHWDSYWEGQGRTSNLVYDFVATVYRNLVIKRRLSQCIRAHFPKGAELLHAGCGSGQVDAEIGTEMEITAVDISVPALNLYRRNNPRGLVKHASILDLPFPESSFDGVYNLGVVEHFTEAQILNILSEIHRVVRRNGKVIIFWPHARATSVLVLKMASFVLNSVLKRNVTLHPAEISLLRSRKQAEDLIRKAGFSLVDYYFGMRDFFVQAVVVIQRLEDA